MSWSTDDIPNQHGRIAVITGANGGLGLETARALAAKGAHVVMAVRNPQKAAAAEEDIKGTFPDASLEIVTLDLGSQVSVHDAAATILAQHPRIDLLINNAGVMAIAEGRTVDGFEEQFGVDHLGHWTLTALLLPALVNTAGARIVTVTSTAHHMGHAVDPTNPNLEGHYGAWRAYYQAKLANFHFGLGLDRELRKKGALVASLIAHPGLSKTDLQTTSVAGSDGGVSQRVTEFLTRLTGASPAKGALSQLRAASDPAANGGDFFGPLFVNNGPPVRKPVLRRVGMDSAISTLWQVSTKLTGTSMDV
jgi:NAD(P)-dependent dehydrogenase (short-subunit alcohol dehydrogenase family)